jgi:perosamine synthetase
MTNKKINWWRTGFANGEADAIVRAIENENISQGPIVEEFEHQLAAYLGVPYVIATTSGSMALLMSLWVSGIGPGDEVIIPNRTWIATAHSALLLGATVKLVDVEPHRPIIDTTIIEQAITDRTRAIIPVHMCGRSADMIAINKIADKHKLVVIEDAAQALGSRNGDGYLGTQSNMGCFSFSVAKIISTGQGGFIATHDAVVYEKLIKMRTHGVGSVVDAVWDQPGFNFRFTDILAAIGKEQLKLLTTRIDKVKKIYQTYADGIVDVPNIKLIPVDNDAGEVPVYIEALCETRGELIDFLSQRGIQSRPFYPDLNHAKYLNNSGVYPNSELYGRAGMYLPSGPDQSIGTIEKVIHTIREFSRTE